MNRKLTPPRLRQEQKLIFVCFQHHNDARTPPWAALPCPAMQETMFLRWCQIEHHLKGALQ